MIAWPWLLLAFTLGLTFGWVIAALCVIAARSDRHFSSSDKGLFDGD